MVRNGSPPADVHARPQGIGRAAGFVIVRGRRGPSEECVTQSTRVILAATRPTVVARGETPGPRSAPHRFFALKGRAEGVACGPPAPSGRVGAVVRHPGAAPLATGVGPSGTQNCSGESRPWAAPPATLTELVRTRAPWVNAIPAPRSRWKSPRSQPPRVAAHSAGSSVCSADSSRLRWAFSASHSSFVTLTSRAWLPLYSPTSPASNIWSTRREARL